MGDGERTLDDLQVSHVEHIPARLGARQSVVDEVEEWLRHLSGMGGRVGKVAAKSGLKSFWMAERPDRGLEGVKGGNRFGRESVEHLDARRVSWMGVRSERDRSREDGPVLAGAGQHARANADERQRTHSAILEGDAILQIVPQLTFALDQRSLRNRYNDERPEVTRRPPAAAVSRSTKITKFAQFRYVCLWPNALVALHFRFTAAELQNGFSTG